MPQPFSLVTTVFNEIRRLDQTIADIEKQTVLPAEILIADAGSTDGTLERLHRWQKESSISVVVFVMQGCNIAEGRNEAIRRARYELIVSTDFGCRYSPHWLANLTAPFEDPAVDVAGGAFTILRDEITTLAAEADYLLQNGYPVVLDQDFSPSSRSIAYYRRVWESVGGYCEWLTLAADDTLFWRMIRRDRFRYVLCPEPDVYWLRHKTFGAFGREAYRYGLGDGESGINFRNMLSHVAETICRYALFLLLAAFPLIIVSAWWYALLLLVPLSAGLRSYRNALRNRRTSGRPAGLRIILAAFRLIEISRWYYLRGYLKGWLFATPAQREGRAKLRGLA